MLIGNPKQVFNLKVAIVGKISQVRSRWSFLSFCGAFYDTLQHQGVMQ